MNALGVLRVYFIIYQLVSLELGIYLAIKLPYLSYSAVEENLGQIADCSSYLSFLSINNQIHPDLTFCTKNLGCKKFEWKDRREVRIFLLGAFFQGVLIASYFFLLMGVVLYQIMIDILELVGLYYFWKEWEVETLKYWNM